jgi:hypothetical protein
LFPLSLVLGLVIVSVSNGQKHNFVPDLPGDAFRNLTMRQFIPTVSATDPADESNKSKPAASEEKPENSRYKFDLLRINEQIIKEFDRAWSLVKAGTVDAESVVLLFRKPDGTYIASSARYTNEYRKLTFTWQANAIAIVHTHPNSAPSKPTEEDMKVADKYGVPIFTITNRGMFMYDPATKNTVTVHRTTDWLNPAKWSRDQIVAFIEK